MRAHVSERKGLYGASSVCLSTYLPTGQLLILMIYVVKCDFTLMMSCRCAHTGLAICADATPRSIDEDDAPMGTNSGKMAPSGKTFDPTFPG